MVGSVEPLLDGSIDSPTDGGGDHFRGCTRTGLRGRHSSEERTLYGGNYGGFDERLEGIVAAALAGVGEGEVVAGGENEGSRGGGAASVVTDVALGKQPVETAGDHGFE